MLKDQAARRDSFEMTPIRPSHVSAVIPSGCMACGVRRPDWSCPSLSAASRAVVADSPGRNSEIPQAVTGFRTERFAGWARENARQLTQSAVAPPQGRARLGHAGTAREAPRSPTGSLLRLTQVDAA
jgi:hypothetical protein